MDNQFPLLLTCCIFPIGLLLVGANIGWWLRGCLQRIEAGTPQQRLDLSRFIPSRIRIAINEWLVKE